MRLSAQTYSPTTKPTEVFGWCLEMEMKIPSMKFEVLAMALALLAFSSRGSTNAPSGLVLTSGNSTLTNCVIIRTNSDAVVVSHRTGIATVPFEDLPDALRSSIPQVKARDTALAAAAKSKEDAENNAVIIAAAQKAERNKPGLMVWGHIVQITDEGILLGGAGRFPAGGGLGIHGLVAPEGESIFVQGVDGRNFLDGAEWSGRIECVGIKRYTTILGAGKSIQLWRLVK